MTLKATSRTSESLDSLYPLKELSKRLPSRPSLATVYRWANQGCNGSVLQTVAIGRLLFTSDQYVHDFIASLSSSRESVESHARRLGL